MKYVACLCGCPGGGKSTFARRLHAEMVGRHAGVLSPVIVSFDEVAADYFGLLTFKEIRAKALDIVADLIRSSNDMHNVIIIDDTMHYHSMRREVYTLVRDLQGMLRMVWLICDVDTAVERDKIRESSLGEKVALLPMNYCH